jgi:hypothetical protein
LTDPPKTPASIRLFNFYFALPPEPDDDDAGEELEDEADEGEEPEDACDDPENDAAPEACEEGDEDDPPAACEADPP